MKTLQDAADYYLLQLRAGDFESAFHGLTDLDPAVVRPLIAAHRVERSPEVRNKILRIVAEFRTPTALPLLDEVVRDRRGDQWKVALDGLVSLASVEAASALESVLREETSATERDSEYLEWVSEALEQIQQTIISRTRPTGA